ncbi:MAG: hypothetical protein HY049_19180 [Acidobacteria bacterium]|nr:hypothetical protein [Acidobacteriota bacterium]
MRSRDAVTGILVVALGCAALAVSFARQEGGSGAQPAEPDPNSPDGQSVEPPKILPPSAYAEGERPPAKTKLYDARPAKVWAAIQAALAAAEVPVESADEAAGAVKTRLILFQSARFYDVAMPPPRFTRERPVYQIIHLNQGWFSIDVQVEKAKGGTSVSVRAYIEENAHDLLNARKLRAERYSNGKIEDYFFARFDDALK